MLTSVSASAETISSLKVDLDRDGRADSVRIVSLNKDYSRLQVKLSASRKVITLDSLLSSTADQNEGVPEEERRSACESVSDLSLKAGKNGSFKIFEKWGDYEACAGESSREFTVRLARGELVVTKQKINSDNWSMGDSSPILNITLNYNRNGGVFGSMDDHHAQHMDVPPTKGSERLACAAVPLKQFEKENFPSCAKQALERLTKKIEASCGRNYGPKACPMKDDIY